MNIGIVFGGYCPMHKGHLDIIMNAKKNNDKVILIVCGYDNEPRANQLGADLSERTSIIKEFFKDDTYIQVMSVNDTELGLDESCSIENWKIWSDYVFAQIPVLFGYSKDEHKFKFYVAEVPYYGALHNRLGYDCELLNKGLKVSATKIRNNAPAYWDYIIEPFKKFLVRKILVIGTASEGKSTLVKDIAKYFDIPCVEEYSRTYMQEHYITHDSQLTMPDFLEFLKKQTENTIEAANNSTKPFIICDTDNLVTAMYAYAYAHDPDMPYISIEDFNITFVTYLKSCINKIKWDKIFLISPGGVFVDDGTRYMKQSTMEERRKNYKYLKKLVNKYYNTDNVVELPGGEYYYNFLNVKSYIEQSFICHTN